MTQTVSRQTISRELQTVQMDIDETNCGGSIGNTYDVLVLSGHQDKADQLMTDWLETDRSMGETMVLIATVRFDIQIGW